MDDNGLGLCHTGTVGKWHKDASGIMTMDKFIQHNLSQLQLNSVTIFEAIDEGIRDILFNYRWQYTVDELKKAMTEYNPYHGQYTFRYTSLGSIEWSLYVDLNRIRIGNDIETLEHRAYWYDQSTLSLYNESDKLIGELSFSSWDESQVCPGIYYFEGWYLSPDIKVYGWMDGPLTSSGQISSFDGTRNLYDRKYSFQLAPNEYIVSIMSITKFHNLLDDHIICHLQFRTNLNRVIGQDSLSTSPTAQACSIEIFRRPITFFEGLFTSRGLVYLSMFYYSRWSEIRWLILLRAQYQENKAIAKILRRPRKSRSNRDAYSIQKMFIALFGLSPPLFKRICMFV